MSGSPIPFSYGDPEVLRLLLSRGASASVPRARRDDHRLALVVGGGGMRGAYTSGMLRALQYAGLRDAVDEVYGASSGAFAGAAFLTGDAEAGAAAYPDDLSTRTFIDLRRLAGPRPVVSLDHLIHEVLGRRKPLRWQELSDLSAPLHVVATDTADLTAHTLAPVGEAAWRTAIRASAAIPLLTGPPIEIDGRRWIDGSIAEPLATARALVGGATHVLVLLCRGESELHPRSGAELSGWARLLDRLVPGLGTLAQGSRRYRRELEMIAAAADPSHPAAHLAAIGPSRSAGVSGLSIDRERLLEAVNIGDSSVAMSLDAAAVGGA